MRGRQRKEPCIWDHIHGQGQGNVLVGLETIAVIPEVVLCVMVLEVHPGVLAPLDDVVPQDYLVNGVVLRTVMGSQVQEYLLCVPVEYSREVTLQVEGQEPEIVLLSSSRVVGYVLHHGLPSRHFNVHDLTVILECG